MKGRLLIHLEVVATWWIFVLDELELEEEEVVVVVAASVVVAAVVVEKVAVL